MTHDELEWERRAAVRELLIYIRENPTQRVPLELGLIFARIKQAYDARP
jgi:hypothetical protein